MDTSPQPGRFQKLLTPTQTLSPTQQALQERLAFLVGCAALALPAILWLLAHAPKVCMRDSISHFYYDPFLGTMFAGILFFIGGFMIALTGENRLEKYGSSLAGIGAFALALFPTSGDGCEHLNDFSARPFAHMTRPAAENASAGYIVAPYDGGAYFAVTSSAEHLHMYGAGVVFVFLGLYCYFVLARVIDARHKVGGELIATKRNRNRLYKTCGVVILLCVATLGAKSPLLSDAALLWWNRLNLTFYVEALALLAFAVAWFAKGRRFTRLNDTEVVPLSRL
ncbi:hypothetical protein shim_36750 [Shimia sp. SK013]|uniref:hypothetical protein n=1 Tax=Shimia sp. SK013 TaxID=1389006 RepID=UPI0006B4A8EF|nr:hypothetical protein [Shimia sp. SK013]KPA20177.1 hypothetical protein shim_36750 [Shimia sp. SK013]